MMKNYYILLILAIPLSSVAQTANVVVSNHPSGDRIQIKYYTESLHYAEGVNIYRRQQGSTDWVKINPAPLEKGKVKPTQQEFDNDIELKVFTNMLDSASSDQITGFILLACLVKSFQSEPFASYLGILYTDTTVQIGNSYEYQIRRATRREQIEGVSASITAGEFVPIEPPSEITVSNDKEVVRFSWLPETNRYFGVNIYRQKNDEEKELITKQPVMISQVKNERGDKGYGETLFEDDSLEAGNVYLYELTAVDFFGRESKFSEQFRVEIKDTTPPPPPEKVTIEEDHGQVQATIKWNVSIASDLNGYYVYRSQSSEGTYERVSDLLMPGMTNFIDFPQRSGNYYYYVSSIDHAGNEANSNKVYAELRDITPPSIPGNVVAKSDTGKINISWTAVNEPDLMGYQVFRTVNENKRERFALLNATPIKATTYEDTLPKNVRNKFLYKVLALDSSYNKSPFSEVASITLPDVTPPVAPFIKKVSAVASGLVIEWLPLINNDVTSISLIRSEEGEATILAILGPKELQYVDRQVAAGASYNYFLVATDSAGNKSENSNVFAAGLPGKKSLSKINNLNASYDSLSSVVIVTWESINEEITGFVVYRKEGQHEFRPVTGLIRTQEFRDFIIDKKRSYIYRVKAFDETGLRAESESHTIEIK